MDLINKSKETFINVPLLSGKEVPMSRKEFNQKINMAEKMGLVEVIKKKMRADLKKYYISVNVPVLNINSDIEIDINSGSPTLVEGNGPPSVSRIVSEYRAYLNSEIQVPKKQGISLSKLLSKLRSTSREDALETEASQHMARIVAAIRKEGGNRNPEIKSIFKHAFCILFQKTMSDFLQIQTANYYNNFPKCHELKDRDDSSSEARIASPVFFFSFDVMACLIALQQQVNVMAELVSEGNTGKGSLLYGISYYPPNVQFYLQSIISGSITDQNSSNEHAAYKFLESHINRQVKKIHGDTSPPSSRSDDDIVASELPLDIIAWLLKFNSQNNYNLIPVLLTDHDKEPYINISLYQMYFLLNPQYTLWFAIEHNIEEIVNNDSYLLFKTINGIYQYARSKGNAKFDSKILTIIYFL